MEVSEDDLTDAPEVDDMDAAIAPDLDLEISIPWYNHWQKAEPTWTNAVNIHEMFDRQRVKNNPMWILCLMNLSSLDMTINLDQ